jgi:hypothetical protein
MPRTRRGTVSLMAGWVGVILVPITPSRRAVPWVSLMMTMMIVMLAMKVMRYGCRLLVTWQIKRRENLNGSVNIISLLKDYLWSVIMKRVASL